MANNLPQFPNCGKPPATSAKLWQWQVTLDATIFLLLMWHVIIMWHISCFACFECGIFLALRVVECGIFLLCVLLNVAYFLLCVLSIVAFLVIVACVFSGSFIV